MSRITTCGLTILLALPPAALAVDGTVLINQSTIANGLPGCPTGGHFPIVICQPGSYRLSGNLVVPDANTTAIQITVNDVAIDLNGFAIVGPGTKGSGFGITSEITSPVFELFVNSSVSNGTIRGMGSAGVLVEDSIVYKVQASANGGDGIDASGNSLVSECISKGNGGAGLGLSGTAMNNIVISNGSDGIESFAASITGNRVVGNGGLGINALGFGAESLISGNFVTRNSQAGISAACPSSIIGNQVTANSGGAIVTSGSGCLLVNNVAQ